MLAVTYGMRSTGTVQLAPVYADALSRFGFDYEPINCEIPQRAAQIAQQYDGILFIGGDDTNPLLYGQYPDPRCTLISRIRDDNELALCRAFYALKKPMFGICRGLQLINVALGGTLHQHIEHHRNTAHRVQLAGGTPLHEDAHAGLYTVNSFHHQALWRISPDLVPIAKSSDGITEAVVGASSPILAVQWHPERPDCPQLGESFFTAMKKML